MNSPKPSLFYSFSLVFVFFACTQFSKSGINSDVKNNAKNNAIASFQTDDTGVLPLVDHRSFFGQMYYDLFANIIENHPIIAIPTADGFDYPFGPKTTYTQRNDGDGWYNRQDFRVNNHMGEDWNREGGAAADCGEAVLAVADGLVIYAAYADKTWGNILIVRHKLPNGEQVESLYAHVQNKGMIPYLSKVKRRQSIALVGDGADPCGDGRPYGAHLHFEMRSPRYSSWGNIGKGYDNAANATGALDPSNYIDGHRHL